VLVTGHTGFKGAWLTEWLVQLGADVTGLSLPPSTQPALFDQLSLASRMHHLIGDIREAALVRRIITDVQPDFVFHLAAQPLVRLSYEQPLETYATNIMGTAHVLDALRLLAKPCAAMMVTTDKCYENREWVHSYREDDAMGGYDPYSSSKAAAELVISAYRRSYFSRPNSVLHVASARAGNVIGGGDWAPDRIVPDCVRALQRGELIPVRNKVATRPWQHVLEPLSGYLWLGACLANPRLAPIYSAHSTGSGTSALTFQLASAFNFGPMLQSTRTVAGLVEQVLKHWPGQWEDKSDPHAVHEAKLLNLAIDKAQHFLGWKPVWSFEDTVRETMQWYRAADEGADAAALTSSQIRDYTTAAARRDLTWAGCFAEN